MSLSLNVSDPLYNNICMCIMVDGASVVDVANPAVTITRNASGSTNVIAPGFYGDGFGLDGSGSFTSWGWTLANVPATLGPAGISGMPGNVTNNNSSIFVAANSFASANSHSPFFDCSAATNKAGASSGKGGLYLTLSGGATLTGVTSLSTTAQFPMMTTWSYNAGAGGAQIYYGASSTPDITASSTNVGSTSSVMQTLGPASGQGNVHASIFCIVVLDTIVSGSDYLRLANSLTGSGAFALVTGTGGGSGGSAILLDSNIDGGMSSMEGGMTCYSEDSPRIFLPPRNILVPAHL